MAWGEGNGRKHEYTGLTLCRFSKELVPDNPTQFDTVQLRRRSLTLYDYVA